MKMDFVKSMKIFQKINCFLIVKGGLRCPGSALHDVMPVVEYRLQRVVSSLVLCKPCPEATSEKVCSKHQCLTKLLLVSYFFGAYFRVLPPLPLAFFLQVADLHFNRRACALILRAMAARNPSSLVPFHVQEPALAPAFLSPRALPLRSKPFLPNGTVSLRSWRPLQSHIYFAQSLTLEPDLTWERYHH